MGIDSLTIAGSLTALVVFSSFCFISYCTEESRNRWRFRLCGGGENSPLETDEEPPPPSLVVVDIAERIAKARALLKVVLAPYTKMLEEEDFAQASAEDEKSALNESSNSSSICLLFSNEHDVAETLPEPTNDNETDTELPAVSIESSRLDNTHVGDLGVVLSNSDLNNNDEESSSSLQNDECEIVVPIVGAGSTLPPEPCLETDEELGLEPTPDRHDGNDEEEEPETSSACECSAVEEVGDGALHQETSLETDEELGIETCQGTVTVPMPGIQHFYAPGTGGGDKENPTGQQKQPSSLQQRQRLVVRAVPNQCCICLSPYLEQDDVTWSSNPNCQHVFHHECIYGWLQKSLLRYMKKTERQQQQYCVEDAFAAMTCPCCRQPFVERSRHAEQETVEPAR